LATKSYIPLYVVLQGEFALFSDKDAQPGEELCIQAPKVEGHTYIAGPWMGETHIATGRKLNLRQARGGSAKPEDFSGLFLTFGKVKSKPEGAQVDIRASLPYGFLPGLREDASNDRISLVEGDQETAILQPKNPAVVSILVYKWEVGTEMPGLFGDAGKWLAGPSFGCLSLHIFASGRTLESDDHAVEAFKAAGSLLGLKLKANLAGGSQSMPSSDAPAGLIWPQVNLLLCQREYFAGNGNYDRLFEDAPLTDLIPAHLTLRNGNCGSAFGFEEA
jgi:hypothetical protein